MKNIKGFNSFNESKIGDTIRKKINKDEEVGVRTLSKVENLTKSNIFNLKVEKTQDSTYKFSMSGVTYKVKFKADMYFFSRDNVPMNVSDKIVKELYKKAKELSGLQNASYSGPLKRDI